MELRPDVVTVGGGLGGAALAQALARAGVRVVVLERAREFRDRVRGEVLVPWGCVEAARLDLLDRLRARCAHEVPYWDLHVDGQPVLHRDIPSTSEPALPVLTYYHPAMQDLMLEAAEEAGATVLRGAVATGVECNGHRPKVAFRSDGATHVVETRLVVGADGRGSGVRRMGGFRVVSDPRSRCFAGVLLEGVKAPEDSMQSRFAPSQGAMSWLFPQGGGRVRAYVGFRAGSGFAPLSGERDLPRFFETSVGLGVPPEAFETARATGPLATFDATDTWVPRPYRSGVALIGDAAATSDPTWGQGMSHTLRDVRVLSEQLLASNDWEAAGQAYAVEHDRAHEACHTADSWYTELFLDVGPEADQTRARAFPRLLADWSRLPDTPLSGPGIVPDEEARRRLFGLD